MANEPELARATPLALAINTKPDYCRVGDAVVPFDIVCDLSRAVSYSPDVSANGEPVLTVSHRLQGIDGNQGRGIHSGTAGASGYVDLSAGSATVRINDRCAVRHGDACQMNCNAAGQPNCPGKVYTSQVAYTPPTDAKAWYSQAGEESARVLEARWDALKAGLATLWQATGIDTPSAQAAAARARIGTGLIGTLEGLGALLGPPPELSLVAELSGDPQARDLVEALRQRQLAAFGALGDSLVQALDAAHERNGPAGAEDLALLNKARAGRLRQARPEAGHSPGDGVVVRKHRLAPNVTFELNGYRCPRESACSVTSEP